MIYFVVPATADWTVREYLSRWGLGVAERIRIVHYEDFLSASSFERGTYVLSALCVLTEEMRRRLAQRHDELSGEADIRFLNHPFRTLRRFALLEELWGRGWNEFRAARAVDGFAALRYPVFLRSETTHDGALSPILRSQREVEAAIALAMLRGRDVRDLLVVEFCDTVDTRGDYRKYSAYIVGDRILARSVERGRVWMVKHSRSEFTRDVLEEEREYVLGNPHRQELSQIFALAGVQYGRIDYAIREGRVQTWEINLHPTIGRGPGESKRNLVPSELIPFREETKALFHRAFQAAWEAVDVDAQGRPSVSIESKAEPLQGLAVARRLSLLHRARRLVLRPVPRLAEALGAPFLPSLGRQALRRAREDQAAPFPGPRAQL